MQIEEHQKFNKNIEEQTPVMDLLIKGHMRREQLAQIKEENIKLIQEQRARKDIEA